MVKRSQIAPIAVLAASPLFGKLVGSFPGEFAGRVARVHDGSDAQSALAGAVAGGVAGGAVSYPFMRKVVNGGKIMNRLGLSLASKNKRWALAAMLAPTAMAAAFGGLRGYETERRKRSLWNMVEDKLRNR